MSRQMASCSKYGRLAIGSLRWPPAHRQIAQCLTISVWLDSYSCFPQRTSANASLEAVKDLTLTVQERCRIGGEVRREQPVSSLACAYLRSFWRSSALSVSYSRPFLGILGCSTLSP